MLSPLTADLERRFGGLKRLYGDVGYTRVRGARIAVVGVGGVGSWAAEALARCGVAELTLVDLDHVAESNINRQVQALGATVGMAKVQALSERIADIHPGCKVHGIEQFATPDNWPALLTHPIDALIDACDQVRTKQTLATWARHIHLPFVCVGAAGGKRVAHRVDIDDLANTTHDPLLASLRQRLRKHDSAPRTGVIGVRCVYSKEAVQLPVDAVCAAEVQGDLSCHGYGSSVTVTASFGFAAAGEVIAQLLADRP